jgi:uncharacterized lipoprotein NlpE involved in copper resistance
MRFYKMADQTFTMAGISAHNGNAKVRFANDMVRRIKLFLKGKSPADRVDFIELPTAMTKIEALKYLQAHEQFQSAADQATIADTLADKVKAVSKGEVKVRTPKAKAKPSLDSIKARAKKVAPVTAEEVVAVVAEAQATE